MSSATAGLHADGRWAARNYTAIGLLPGGIMCSFSLKIVRAAPSCISQHARWAVSTVERRRLDPVVIHPLIRRFNEESAASTVAHEAVPPCGMLQV